MSWIINSPDGKCTGYSLKKKRIETLQFAGRITPELVKQFVVQPFQSLARILVFTEAYRMSKLQLAETLNVFISLWDPTLLLQSQSMTQASEGIFQLLIKTMNKNDEPEKIYMILKIFSWQPGDEKSIKLLHPEIKGYVISILELHRLIVPDFTDDEL